MASPPAPIAGIVLAAGLSSRAAPENKLMRPVGGAPMVARVAETALGAGLAPVVVVTGHQADDIAAAVAGTGAETVFNANYADGMGGSIGCGVKALAEGVPGVVILLGDMPDVKSATIAALAAHFGPDRGAAICVPVNGGRRGNPVLFAARFFPALCAIEGDKGAKAVVQASADKVLEVAVDDPGVLVDYDGAPTPRADK